MPISPQQRKQGLALLTRLLIQHGVEPKAAMAVFGREGASGGIGDNGHAFGPGQENDAGGVLTGRFHGRTPEQLNAWAWSPAGLADLAGRVGSVAHGLHGEAAIRSIVTRFERPLRPQAEIVGALRDYGLPGAAGPSLGAGGATGAPESFPGLYGASGTRSASPEPAQSRRQAGLALLANWNSPYSGLGGSAPPRPDGRSGGAYAPGMAGGAPIQLLPNPGVNQTVPAVNLPYPGGPSPFRALLLAAARAGRTGATLPAV